MKKPEQLTDFRKVTTEGLCDLDLQIPAPGKERTVTDKKGFLIYGTALLFYFCLFGYLSLHKSETRFLVKSGSVSVVESSLRNTFLTTGRDRGNTTGPYYLPITSFQNLKNDENIQISWKWFGKFIFITIVTLSLIVLVLNLLLHAPVVLIWAIICSTVLILFMLTYISWRPLFRFDATWNMKQNPKLFIPLCVTSAAVLTLFLLPWMFYKKTTLLTKLYQEAVQVAFAMSGLLVPTILIHVLQVIVLCCFVIAAFPMASEFNKPSAIIILITNVIMTQWSMQIIKGFQCMVIAGSVAAWYFTSFRQFLKSAIVRSALKTLRFHIGTIVFGTFLSPFLLIIKLLSNKLPLRRTAAEDHFESFSKKNAFIVTALHGRPFTASGKRAFRLLNTNSKLSAIRPKADVMLLLIEFNLIVCSCVLSFAFEFNLPMVICAILNISLIFVMCATFENIIYTLLLCFCEDLFIDNANRRPYRYTTEILKEIFEETSSNQKRYNKNLILGQMLMGNGNYTSL